MKTNITVSLCISNDFVVDVEEATPENLYDAFMAQHGLKDGKWLIDDIEIINNERREF